MIKGLFKIIYVFVLFFFAVVIAHYHWFSYGEILQFGDWGYRFLEYSKNLYLEWGAWSSAFQLGSPNVTL